MENNVFAVVAGRKITQENVEHVMKNFDAQTAAQFNSPEGLQRILFELINQELFYMDATDNNMDQEEDFKAQLEKVKEDLIKQYYVSKLLRNVQVDDQAVLEFYGLNRDRFVEGESVRASHVLVNTEQEALDILNQINKGMAFEEAAKKFSKCPSKEEGGDLGYFSKGKMVPEFEEAAFDMKIDEISLPVKSQFGYHVIKVVDKKGPKIQSFDEVKDSIRNYMISEKQQEIYFEKVNELKSKYPVKINVE